jgi:predicted porin
MKKSLLALAVLGAFAGVASAQSSVTLSGTVDVSAKYVKNSGAQRRYSLDSSGINSSQLVFSGVEDLGGGLKAGFELNSGLAIDTGAAGGATFFNRRSVARLMGNFGEIRLGRDYAPTFWNTTVFDAFGTNGVGSSLNVIAPTAAAGVTRLYMGTRRDNSIGYFLPSNIGGIYGQVMVAAAENGTTTDRAGRYIGGRVGWAGGPANVAFSYGQQRYTAGTPDTKTYNLGGSFDLGVAKLLGYWDHESQGNQKGNLFSGSVVVPFGQSEIHAGYDYDRVDNGSGLSTAKTKVDQIKVGYVYNLSKRTAVYSTVSRLSNKNGTSLAIPGGNPISAGGKSTAAEFGVRHFF